MAYEDFKDLTRRTASDKILLVFGENLKYDGYQIGLASIVYPFFDKKSASLVGNVYWGYPYLTNLHFTNLCLTNLRQTQNT